MKIKLLLILFCVSIFSHSNAQNNYEILLKSGKFTPDPITNNFKIELKDSENNESHVFRVIQFTSIPTENEKVTIKNTGVELIEYLPNNAFISKIPVKITNAELKKIKVRSLFTLTYDQKIDQSLKNRKYPDWAINGKQISLNVSYYHKNDYLKVVNQIKKLKGEIINNSLINVNTLEVSIPISKINELAELTTIKFLEPIAPPSEKEDTKGRSLHRSNAINSPSPLGRKYDGTGVTVSLADDGAIGPHIDFQGRLTQDGSPNNGTHGDMTSGILCGAGNIDPNIMGMAPGAYLMYYDIGNYPQVLQAVSNFNNDNTVLSSTSYSQGTGGQYTSSTSYIDQQLNQNNQLIHIFSAGNAGFDDHGYGAGSGWGNITGGYKAGKNVIACGNLNNLDVLEGSSSRGPADDGRIKPDICANGIGQLSTDENNTYQVGGGTSAAAPGISGITTQLYHAYRENNGGSNPDVAILKAAMLNTAEDLGNPGPDFQHGWGRVNALKAVRVIEDNTYFNSTISQGQNNNHFITVPNNVFKVRIMAYWTDVQGSPVAAKALVNDINMTVQDPSSTIYNPWILDPTPNANNLNANAIRGVDNLNNMEQVTIENPVAGNYTVNLNGFSIPNGPQNYYLVYDFIYDNIEITYPNGGESFEPSTQEVIRWDAGDNTGTFTLEYSFNGGSNWITISNAIQGDRRYFQWNVPNNLTGSAKIRLSRNGISDENDENFTIVRSPSNLQIVSVCPDTITLDWNNLTGINTFEVSMLGNKYMDSISRTNVSEIKIPNLNPNEEHWFSVKAIKTSANIVGQRAIAIRQAPGVNNCLLQRNLAVEEVITPISGQYPSCLGFQSKEVSLQVKNVGASAITNIDLNYQVNNGPVVTDNFTVSLNPNGSTNLTFTTPVNLSAAGVYEIKIWNSWNQDQDQTNDTITTSIEIYESTTENLPFNEGFDDFASCATSLTCETGLCTLENGWMNLTNTIYDDLDWRTDEGGTPTPNTGPSIDYTLGSNIGKYLYLEVPSNCYGKSAQLMSPCIDLTSTSEAYLNFATHAFGANIGTLHYDVLTAEETFINVPPVFNKNMGDNWIDTTFNISQYAGKIIAIKFRTISGNGQYSDIALDRIGVSNTLSSIKENINSNIKIIPNPNNGLFTIKLNEELKSKLLSIKINNSLGQEVSTNNNLNHFELDIDISNQPKGFYNIILHTEDQIISKKFIKE